MDNVQLKISPNPTTSHFTITFNEEIKNEEIRIIDVMGQCVLQPPPLRGGREGLIDISTLSNGIYFVEVAPLNLPKGERTVMRSKLVKQ